MVSNNVIIVLVAMLIISTISTTYGVNMKHINSHHNKNHQINSHANNHNKVAVGINSKAHANTKLEKLHNIAKQHAKASSLKNVVEAKLPKHHMQLTHTSLVELNSKTTEKDMLHQQALTHAHARAKAHQNAMLMTQVTARMNALGLPSVQAYGRGRGAGRPSMYLGPDEFDNSWWQPPPPVGSDPFLPGYSQKVYPSHLFGYGGMPGGGFGTAHHYWGGPSYKYPLNQPWWRGRSYYGASRASKSPYLPYQTPRDSFGMMQPGMGNNLPVSSPYYYTPPPLQGDWNLPRNPPPPPADAGAAGGGEKKN